MDEQGKRRGGSAHTRSSVGLDAARTTLLVATLEAGSKDGLKDCRQVVWPNFFLYIIPRRYIYVSICNWLKMQKYTSTCNLKGIFGRKKCLETKRGTSYMYIVFQLELYCI